MRIWVLALAWSIACSTPEDDERGRILSDESRRITEVEYTTSISGYPSAADGGIAFLRSYISALPNNNKTDLTPAGSPAICTGSITQSCLIRGIASSGSVIVFEDVRAGTTNPSSRKVYDYSFTIQDATSAILVLYDDDYTPDENSYRDNDFIPGLVLPGDEVRLEVRQVQKYNSAGGVPIVTVFSKGSLTRMSTGNDVYYENRFAAPAAADFARNVRVFGRVVTTPEYVEYSSGTYRFQFNHQQGFRSQIRIADSPVTDYPFQINYWLARGTLDGFTFGPASDGGITSYNLTANDQVQITGPVIMPRITGGVSDLSILVFDKTQVIRD